MPRYDLGEFFFNTAQMLNLNRQRAAQEELARQHGALYQAQINKMQQEAQNEQELKDYFSQNPNAEPEEHVRNLYKLGKVKEAQALYKELQSNAEKEKDQFIRIFSDKTIPTQFKDAFYQANKAKVQKHFGLGSDAKFDWDTGEAESVIKIDKPTNILGTIYEPGSMVHVKSLGPAVKEDPLTGEKTVLTKNIRYAMPYVGEGDKRPYKMGQILPSQEVGDKIVNYQVVGYDQNNRPILEEFSSGPRYKPPGPEKGPTQFQLNNQAANYRKELNNLPEVREYNSIQPKIKSMESAYKESLKTGNHVAIDQTLITLFNKLTDPNSVVRESEYARTAMNLPFFNMIKGKIKKISEGGAGLTQDDREKLYQMGKLIKKGYEDIYNQRVREYRGYASMSGIDPDMIGKEPGQSFNVDMDAIQAELERRKNNGK